MGGRLSFLRNGGGGVTEGGSGVVMITKYTFNVVFGRLSFLENWWLGGRHHKQ